MRFLSTLAASVIGTLVAFGLVIFFLVFFFFALSLSGDQAPAVQSGSVLTVPLAGDVPERVTENPFRKAFGGGPAYDLRELQTSLRKARTDPRVQAVWLRMKGLSAGWATLEEIRQAVRKTRKSGVPVIASSEEFGMSEKGYFVASAADSVFSAPQSSFAYNGFSTILSFFDGTFERLDVEPKIIRAGKYKSAGEPFVRKDLSKANRKQLTALLKTVNNRFVSTVAEARGMSGKTLNRMADEEALLTSAAAAERGLVDGLLYENEVRDRLRSLVEEGVPNGLSTVSIEEYQRVSASSAGQSYTGTGRVDIVYAEGNIVTGSTDDQVPVSGPEPLGSTDLTEALETARTSPSTEAVVVRVNSPGGSAAASEAMWHAVKRTAAKKPVIVSMGDVAASGGYYLAAAADSIVANPTTTTGSIGVFGLVVNARNFFENKLGITFDQVQTSPYADLFSPVQDLEERERRLIGQSIDQTYQTFLQRVADGRGMSVSAVDSVAQGRVWSGRDAEEVGLVDTTGTLTDAVAMAGQAAGLGDGPYRTRLLPRPETFLKRISESLSSQARQMWQSAIRSAVGETLWRKKQMLDRVIGAQGAIQTRLPFTPTVE
ncbi:MAG: signal peptide peptidase SppA [Salinibacter sp.]